MLVLIGGAIWSISLFPTVVWASRVISENAPNLKYEALVAIVAVLMLGWVIVPVLITGVDDTLEPGRFASFGVGARRLMPGLTASSLLTIPALFFLAVFVILAAAWWPQGPATLTVAMFGAVLTLLTIVFSARVAVMWSARVLQSRRSREAMFLALLLGALLITPAIYLLVSDGLEIVLEYDVKLLLDILGGTPIGAPVQAAFDASKHHWGDATLHLAISAAWVTLLHWVWRVNVAHSLVNPLARGGGMREREDTVMAAAVRAEAKRQGTHSSRARVAVTSRTLRYWFTDARYLANLVSVLVFPLLFFMLVYPVFKAPAALVLAVPVLLAGTIGWGRHNDVAYDSTALWMDVVSGRIGREVMTGRILATVTWGAPLAGTAVIVAVAVTGRFDLLPAVIGATFGVLGTSLGVAAITSVTMTYRAPAPGSNPFAAEVGSVGASLVAQLVSSLVAWTVAVPVSLPLALAVRLDPAWGWLGLVTGLTAGSLVLWFATRWAGSIYDRRSGRLVAAVS